MAKLSCRSLLRYMAAVTFTGMCVNGPSALAQQTSEDWKWCLGRDGEPPDVQIQGCTSVIQSGRETNDGLKEALLSRGFAYLDKGDTVRALNDFNEAIRAKPDLRAFYSRGKGYRAAGDLDRAIRDFDESIRLDPSDSFAYIERAKVNRDRGAWTQAARDFDEGLRLTPRNMFARYNRAVFLQGRGETHLAAQDFGAIVQRADDLLRNRPSAADLLFIRGLAKQGKGDATDGAVDIAAAKAIDPQVSEKFWRIAR